MTPPLFKANKLLKRREDKILNIYFYMSISVWILGFFLGIQIMHSEGHQSEVDDGVEITSTAQQQECVPSYCQGKKYTSYS